MAFVRPDTENLQKRLFAAAMKALTLYETTIAQRKTIACGGDGRPQVAFSPMPSVGSFLPRKERLLARVIGRNPLPVFLASGIPVS